MAGYATEQVPGTEGRMYLDSNSKETPWPGSLTIVVRNRYFFTARVQPLITTFSSTTHECYECYELFRTLDLLSMSCIARITNITAFTSYRNELPLELRFLVLPSLILVRNFTP